MSSPESTGPDPLSTDEKDGQPEDRLTAPAADQRSGHGPEDLLRQTDEQIAKRADHGQDDPEPQSTLEATPQDQRRSHGPDDLLKEPENHSDTSNKQ